MIDGEPIASEEILVVGAQGTIILDNQRTQYDALATIDRTTVAETFQIPGQIIEITLEEDLGHPPVERLLDDLLVASCHKEQHRNQGHVVTLADARQDIEITAIGELGCRDNQVER